MYALKNMTIFHNTDQYIKEPGKEKWSGVSKSLRVSGLSFTLMNEWLPVLSGDGSS